MKKIALVCMISAVIVLSGCDNRTIGAAGGAALGGTVGGLAGGTTGAVIGGVAGAAAGAAITKNHN
ncbi:MAG: hypothetical protein A3I77_01295 [Gammaproteobacteria bacterium RIFCSPLOWO2_02_FULL_42_14]|nr:MAG: hypothetical protein A3B71_07480 [Gammaproteobacteria bacterium RIFCSPHIGHO2_02_FULL_42_43]OGT52264.1 MAG: hypothetical protein A3E54_01355 [Gammaproteobacteria bacterium RIFCSPHIGHO2_12_FULL_41_25]OGT61877.1 MAG: hypothetical protein A3I77_01295 [Gammaproteobacteria bacterium RIFCSPLOWO2_02_FULL_42_14]OGT86413.1 MAG: hypothetical protein A3G86_07800 [Gammaproteobacteria bacterium RIFCSPLOWO2_12_FULL_42_18]